MRYHFTSQGTSTVVMPSGASVNAAAPAGNVVYYWILNTWVAPTDWDPRPLAPWRAP